MALYGNLKNLGRFKDTRPAVMKEFIVYTKLKISINKDSDVKHEHDKWFVRFLSWLERHVLHYRIGEWKNYILIK